jgi:hypothetical protein
VPPRPYDLSLQPQRPGELGCELVLPLARDDAAEIELRASTSGLPAPLWSTLAVEATRSITLVEAALGIPAGVVPEGLSAAAAEAGRVERRSRLSDYARALRAAAPRHPATAALGGIALRPGLPTATAWKAEAAGMALEAWILKAVAAAPDGFVAWEAAAADEGRSLPEWALVQAARRRRSASTPAQIAG